MGLDQVGCLRTNLAICQISRSCTYTPFLPQGSSLFSFYEQQFLRYVPIFKIAIFGHETCPLAKVPEVAHIFSFHPLGSKLSLFSLYGQQFLRYGPIFKIAIFGHETWPLAKVPEDLKKTQLDLKVISNHNRLLLKLIVIEINYFYFKSNHNCNCNHINMINAK